MLLFVVPGGKARVKVVIKAKVKANGHGAVEKAGRVAKVRARVKVFVVSTVEKTHILLPTVLCLEFQSMNVHVSNAENLDIVQTNANLDQLNLWKLLTIFHHSH